MNSRIKLLRTSNHLTMKEFGDILGVTQSAISRIEKGERKVTDQMIRSICRAFNVNEEWLLFGTGEKYNESNKEIELIVSYLLEESNPFYDFILETAKTYQQTDRKSKVILEKFCQDLLNNLKQKNNKKYSSKY